MMAALAFDVWTNVSSKLSFKTWAELWKYENQVFHADFTGWILCKNQFILKLRYLWLGCDGLLRPKLGFVWLVNGRSLWVKALWTIRKFSDSNSTSCLARLRDPTSLRGSRWPSARKLTKHSNYLCVSEGGPSIMVQSWPWVSLKAVKKVVFDYRALNAIWKKIVSFVFKQRKMTFCIHNGLSVCVHI